MKMNSKKGVSPLIATVLIIALTVALSVFLMNWAFGFFKERTTATSESTKDQLLCATGINFDVDCGCTQVGAAAPTCQGSFTYTSDFRLGGDVILRLITADGQVLTQANTTMIEPYDTFAVSSMGTLTISTRQPIDLEGIITVIVDSQGKRILCGQLAKLRKSCKYLRS